MWENNFQDNRFSELRCGKSPNKMEAFVAGKMVPANWETNWKIFFVPEFLS
jgi:hypothetical protein